MEQWHFTKRCTDELNYTGPHFFFVKFSWLLESRLNRLFLILGLSALMLLLDFCNPLMNFFKSWNLHYLINNLGEFLAVFAPAFFILGFLVGYDESTKLFMWCLAIPVLHYALKGMLFLYFISQDPNLPHVIGAWFGGYVLDWRDFVFVYTASGYIYVWSIGAICILFMILGLVVNYFFGGGVRSSSVKAEARIEACQKGGNSANR